MRKDRGKVRRNADINNTWIRDVLYRKEESVPRGFKVPAHTPARTPAGFPERCEFDKAAADVGEVRRDRRIIQGRFGRR